MKFTYILPAYIPDEEILALTRATIHSFREATPKATIIIADDCSPVGGGYLRSVADIYIRTSKNQGYVKTINRAIKLADTEILTLANNDIRVSPNWWKITPEIFEDKTVGSVHYKMTTYDVPMTFGNNVWKIGKERWCTTSFVSVHRRVYDKIGLADEMFTRGGYGDWDLWYRARKAGFKTAYTNKACYQHKDSSITNKFPKDVWWGYVEANKAYFKNKWGKSAEELFEEQFPEQMKIDWRVGFE